MSNLSARHQRGLTLVEVMVSITVGLILLSGVISIFVSNKTAYRLQESTNALDENARFALNQLQYHLRMGDHWGGTEAGGGVEPVNIDVDPALAALTIATTCTQSPVVSTVGFFALEGAASTPLDCIPNADYQPNTDVIVIRYAESERTPSYPSSHSPTPPYVSALPPVDTNKLYLRVRIDAAGRLFKGNNLASLPADLYEDPDPPYEANYEFKTVIYFIRKCASQDRGTAGVCDAADDTIPTLTRLVLRDTALEQEDVVAGVEQLQATYGVLTDAASPTTEYFSATTITANQTWPSVVNVQVSMVIRGPEFDVAYTDPNSSYTLAGGFTYTPTTANRHYHRKVLNFATQIRNKTRG